MIENCSLAHLKFSNEQVSAVIEDYGTGNFTTRQLGEKYNCSNATISHIINNKFYDVSGNKDKLDKIKIKNKSLSRYINSSLTEENVLEIRRLCAQGKILIKDIAVMFNVGRNVIGKIKNNRTWTHLLSEAELQKK